MTDTAQAIDFVLPHHSTSQVRQGEAKLPHRESPKQPSGVVGIAVSAALAVPYQCRTTSAATVRQGAANFQKSGGRSHQGRPPLGGPPVGAAPTFVDQNGGQIRC